MKAPSAYDVHPWELVVIDNSKTIEELLSDRLQLKKPPYFINSSKYVKRLGREKYERVSPPPLLIVVAGDPKKCYNDLPGLIASLSCCCENILLASHALGLGSCWLYVHDPGMPQTEKFVKEKLDIPENIIVLAMLAIGYPDEIPLKKLSYELKIRKNNW